MTDRTIVYPGAIPLETDLLSAQRDAMIGLGHLARTMLGTGTYVDGLACAPTSPASMVVNVAPGCIFALETIDASAFSSLGLDASPLVKVGINTTATPFTLAAPITSGQSIAYLIEAQFVEADATAVVLPYYNASNPAVPYSGPSNTGAAQNTKRTQRVSLQMKTGVSATTGTQVTPSVDAGWVGLYVIIVAYGATTVIAGNITTYGSAPFLAAKLPALLPLSGALGGISATQTYAGNPNTHVAGNAAAGLLPPDTCWDTTNGVMYACTTTGNAAGAVWGRAVRGALIGVQVFNTPGTSTYTETPGTASVVTKVLGAGGAGGGAVLNGAGANSLGGSGAGGGYAESRITSAFSGVTVTIGAGGVAVSGANGGAGGTSSFGALVSSPGGGGGVASGSGTAPVGAAGVAGATPSGGNIVNLKGQPGTTTLGIFGQGLALMSPGANSQYGAGGAPQLIGNAGAAATGFGSGGAGAIQSASAAALAGGNGAGGLVIVMEYA